MGVAGQRRRCSRRTTASSRTARSSRSRESPVVPGVVWAGTDDGNVQVSRDGGADVHRSRQEHARRAREDNSTGSRASMRRTSTPARPTSRSTATAATISSRTCSSRATSARRGRRIAGNLPRSATSRWSREDPKNRNLLYARHRVRLLRLARRRQEVEEVHEQLPTVRIDDILVHPRDSDLIVATHGRSIWIADDITPLQQLTRRGAGADAACSTSGRRCLAERPPARPADRRAEGFAGENPPRGAAISLLPEVRARWRREDHHRRRDRPARSARSTAPRRAGINRVMWNLTAAGRQGQGGGGLAAGGSGAAAAGRGSVPPGR